MEALYTLNSPPVVSFKCAGGGGGGGGIEELAVGAAKPEASRKP